MSTFKVGFAVNFTFDNLDQSVRDLVVGAVSSIPVDPVEPSEFPLHGWLKSFDAGVDGDYFVDAIAGDDGSDGLSTSSAFKTIQNAVDQVISDGVPKTVKIIGDGVKYRESVDLLSMAGTAQQQVVISGYGTDKPIITGAEPLTGWVQCDASDEPDIGSNYASIFKTTVDKSAYGFTAKEGLALFENNERMQLSADRADPSSHLRQEDKRTFHVASNFILNGQNEITGIVDADIFGQYTSGQLTNAAIYIYAQPNIVSKANITGFNGVDTITVDGLHTVQKDTSTPDADDLRYGLSNILPAISQGKWAVLDGITDVTVFCWPTDTANLASNIEFCARTGGINLNIANYINIENIELRQFAGDLLRDAIGIGSIGQSQLEKIGLNITNARISGTTFVGSGFGYGGVYLANTTDAKVTQITLEDIGQSVGFYMTSNDNLTISNVDMAGVSKSPMNMFGQTKAVISFWKVDGASYAAHSNLIAAYLGCSDILFHGLDFKNTSGYLTFQQASGIHVLCCHVPSSASNGDRRAYVDQSNDAGEPNPSAVNYVLNSHFPAGPEVVSTGSSVVLGRDNNELTFILHNNIASGIAIGDGHQDAKTHNVITYLSDGQIEDDLDVTEVFEDQLYLVYENQQEEDFRPVAGSPILTTPAKGISTEIVALKAIFPEHNLDRDINGVTVDWAIPFMGPDSQVQAVPDVTNPILTGLVATAIGKTVSFSVNANEGRGSLFWIFREGTDVPDPAEMLAGESTIVSQVGQLSNSALAENTGDHRLHVLQVDLSGNQSDILSSQTLVTTLATEHETVWTPATYMNMVLESVPTTSSTGFTFAGKFRITDLSATSYIFSKSITIYLQQQTSGKLKLLIRDTSGSVLANYNMPTVYGLDDVIEFVVSVSRTFIKVWVNGDDKFNIAIDTSSDLHIPNFLNTTNSSGGNAQSLNYYCVWLADQPIDPEQHYSKFFAGGPTQAVLNGSAIEGVSAVFSQSGDKDGWNALTGMTGTVMDA